MKAGCIIGDERFLKVHSTVLAASDVIHDQQQAAHLRLSMADKHRLCFCVLTQIQAAESSQIPTAFTGSTCRVVFTQHSGVLAKAKRGSMGFLLLVLGLPCRQVCKAHTFQQLHCPVALATVPVASGQQVLVVLQDGMTSTSFVSSQGWQVDWPQLQLLLGVYSGILTSSGLAATSLSARKRAFS
jgi:hypothetical protein